MKGEGTRDVDTAKELEGGGGELIGRKTKPVGFFFFGAFFRTVESSSSESDSDGFRTISVRGGGTSVSDGI